MKETCKYINKEDNSEIYVITRKLTIIDHTNAILENMPISTHMKEMYDLYIYTETFTMFTISSVSP